MSDSFCMNKAAGREILNIDIAVRKVQESPLWRNTQCGSTLLCYYQIPGNMCALFSVCSVQFTVCSVPCAVYSVPYSVGCVQFAVCSVQCVVCSVLYSMYSVSRALCSVPTQWTVDIMLQVGGQECKNRGIVYFISQFSFRGDLTFIPCSGEFS